MSIKQDITLLNLKKPPLFYETVKFLSQRLQNYKYAIRGTASLVLQGFNFVVKDIDIVCDKTCALSSNEELKDYLSEKVEYKVSPKFKSYYGKFIINNIEVEIYGDWQIKDTKGNWSEIYDGSQRIELDFSLENMQSSLKDKVFVTATESELKMYIQMGRWNVYHKLKKEISEKNKI